MKDKYHIWQFLVINNNILHQKNLKNLIKNLLTKLKLPISTPNNKNLFCQTSKKYRFYLRRFTVCMYGLLKLLQLSP